MRDQLERAMKLAKKTGDRLIVYDSQKSDNTYVVMSIDEYEKIVDDKCLTEEEMTDKINRDIAVWKNEQFGLDKKDYHDGWEEPSDNFNFASNDNKRVINDQRRINSDKNKKRSSNSWRIPKDVKKGAENSKNISVDDDEMVDDEQYFEEITF